MYYLLIVISV